MGLRRYRTVDMNEMPSQVAATIGRSTLHVAMRDGVRLATDIYGDLGQARPVLLERTPYGRRAARESDQNKWSEPVPDPESISAEFVERGYIVVRQDCRGRGDSEGKFVKYLNESEDGFDTVQWIASQAWCSGEVFTTGVSYSAHAQAALAALAPPSLSGMILDSGGFSSAYDVGMRMGGAFELKQVTWAFRHARKSNWMLDPVARRSLEAANIRDWFSAFPWRRGVSPLRHAPEYEDFLLEQWSHEKFDDFWTQSSIYARGSYDEFPDIPSMHIGSWYDPYVMSTIENFTELNARANRGAYLVMGPWLHGRRTQTHAGDVEFGLNAAFDRGLGASYAEFRLNWFDAQRSNDATLTMPERVAFFLMGGGSGKRNSEGRMEHGGRWVADSQFPPLASVPHRFHLAAGELLTSTASTESGSVSYDFDPARPVPTMGGQVTSGEPLMVGGAFNQTPDDRFYGAEEPHLPLAARQDVVTFRSEPLQRSIALVGPVVARLRISSSAPDTDFTIKLIDEYPANENYPDGFAMNLTEGIFRCRFHAGFDRMRALVPGTEYDIEVRAPETANLFQAGHRIRLDVSSSNFPRFDVNSNTGEHPNPSRTQNIARNTLHLGGNHGSFLDVHIVEDEAALKGIILKN